MKEVELIKNVYATDSITRTMESPDTWLEDRDEFPIRYVGGIHNLSIYDKTQWATSEKKPLRLIETGTGREEVWFEPTTKTNPVFLSLDSEGRLESHVKMTSVLPAFKQEKLTVVPGVFSSGLMDLSIWYHHGTIMNLNKGDSSVQARKVSISPTSPEAAEYIKYIHFEVLSESWADGEWKSTTAGAMTIIFVDSRLNIDSTQKRASEWIEKHCRGGFFPMSDELFGDKEEEFIFIADICS